MKDFRSVLFSSAGLLCLTSGLSRGALLSQWNFNALNTQPSSVAAGTIAGNFTTSGSFTGTTGPVASGTVSGVDGTSPYVFGVNGLKTSEDAAMDANQFYTFTLTPTVGNAISFSSLSFYGWANNGFNPESYSFFIRTSQTGSTTLQTFTSTVELANGTAPGASSQFILDLSGYGALQEVTTATTFTIGVYYTNPAVGNVLGNLRIDSVQLDGTVAVIPEPAGMLLGSMGVLAMMRRKRV